MTPPQEEGHPLDAAAADLGSGGATAPEQDAAAYRRRMARRQQVQQQRVQARQWEKGLRLVFTGQGKGKTTAGLGLVLRTLGHGERVAVVQFSSKGHGVREKPRPWPPLESNCGGTPWGKASPGSPRTGSGTRRW